PWRRWLDRDGDVFMPVEFSAAASRFGHSLVRPSYQLNDGTGSLPVVVAHPDLDPAAATHLGGLRALAEGLVVDWARFLGAGAQPARAIDTHLSRPLARLPGELGTEVPNRSLAWRNLGRGKRLALPSGQPRPRPPGPPRDLGTEGPNRSLAWRNLVRGKRLGLPSGQAVARAIGETPLDDSALRLAGAAAPLWFYVLAEAETVGEGRH